MPQKRLNFVLIFSLRLNSFYVKNKRSLFKALFSIFAPILYLALFQIILACRNAFFRAQIFSTMRAKPITIYPPGKRRLPALGAFFSKDKNHPFPTRRIIFKIITHGYLVLHFPFSIKCFCFHKKLHLF